MFFYHNPVRILDSQIMFFITEQGAILKLPLLLSGNFLNSYWKWPIEIVGLPIKDGDIP